jgi:hypothetical protein
MTLNPPEGSNIVVIAEGADQTIIIPHESGGAIRYFAGLFILFWLGGWFVAFGNTVPKVFTDNPPPFLIFWLGGWTLGGVFAMYYLYRIFRPAVPESLKLTRNSVIYDSGIPPFQMTSRYANAKEAWQSLLPKRTRVEIDRRQLQSLRLRDTDTGNRLTVDAGALRIDVAKSASEVEREWLYQVLARHYSLPFAPTPGV